MCSVSCLCFFFVFSKMRALHTHTHTHIICVSVNVCTAYKIFDISMCTSWRGPRTNVWDSVTYPNDVSPFHFRFVFFSLVVLFLSRSWVGPSAFRCFLIIVSFCNIGEWQKNAQRLMMYPIKCCLSLSASLSISH